MAIQQTTYATPRLDLGAAMYEYDPMGASFAGAQILPIFQTPKKAATFSKITRESLLKRAAAKRASKAAYNRIDTYAEDDSFACEEYGLEGALGDDERALYASDFDAEEATTYTVWLKLMMEHEVRVQTLIQNTTTWTGASLYTDVSSAPWDTAASDVISHVLAAKEKVRLNTGVSANALILSGSQAANLLKNTGIKNQFPGAQLITLAMVEQALASIFGLQRLIVCGQVYDSAAEGQAFSGAEIWNDDYAMVARVANPNDRLTTPSLGRTFLWAADTPDVATVEQYREEQTRSDIFRCRQYTDEKVFDPYFGHLLKID